MFGLGLPEVILIFVIALLIFGPKKLPDLGKSIGSAMAQFKKASEDFQESVREEMQQVEKKSGLDEIKKINQLDLTTVPEQKSIVSEPEQTTVPESEEPSDQPQKKPGKTRKKREAKPNV